MESSNLREQTVYALHRALLSQALPALEYVTTRNHVTHSIERVNAGFLGTEPRYSFYPAVSAFRTVTQYVCRLGKRPWLAFDTPFFWYVFISKAPSITVSLTVSYLSENCSHSKQKPELDEDHLKLVHYEEDSCQVVVIYTPNSSEQATSHKLS